MIAEKVSSVGVVRLLAEHYQSTAGSRCSQWLNIFSEKMKELQIIIFVKGNCKSQVIITSSMGKTKKNITTFKEVGFLRLIKKSQ